MKLLPITITGKTLSTPASPTVKGDKDIDALSIAVPVSYEGTNLAQDAWHIRFKLPGGTVHTDPLADGVPDDVEAPTTLTFTYPMQGLIVSQSGNVALQIINVPANGSRIFQTLPGPSITVSSTLEGPPSADYNAAPWGTYLAQYEAIRDEAKQYRDQAQQIASNIHDEYVLLDEKKVDKVPGKGLSTEDYTTAEKSKLAGIEGGAQVNTVTSVAGKTGAVVLAKGDVGLSLVDNTPDAQKPVSSSQQAALDLKIPLSQKGSASGVATLDEAGKVPSTQLPSYVDDILEFGSFSLLPASGESGKIYVTLDTNLQYRWSGSAYTQVSKSLALGETPESAHRGDHGKLAYEHVAKTNNPHAVTASQVGLGKVVNKTEAELVASGAIADALALKFDKSSLADNYDGGATKALSAEKGKDLNARLSAAETAIDYLNNRSVKIYGAAFGVTSDTSERLFDAVGLVARRANGSVNSEKSDFLSVGPWARMKKVLFDNTSVIKAEMGDTLFNALRATDTLNEGTKFEKFYSFDGEVTIGGVRKRVMLVSDYNVKHIYLGENEGSPVYVDLTCEPKFIREDGTERPYTIISSCHTGRDSAGTLWFGKPGVFPEVNRSIVNFDTLYPTGMYGYHFASSSILEKLLSIEWCSLNSQASVGAGINASMPYGSGNEFKCTVSQTGANSIIIANAGAVNMRVGMVMQIGTSYTSQNVAANRTITAIEDYDASNKRITVDGAAFDSVSGTTTIVSWGQPVPKSQLESMGLDCGWISQFDSENRSHVFAYGIADVWGNVWSFERGKMRNNGRWYFCWHPAKCKGVTNPVGADGYIDSQIDFYMPGNGYLKEVQFFTHEGKSTWFPKAVGASSASYYADYCYYFTSDYTGVRVVIRFGNWDNGSYVGLWYVYGNYTPGKTLISVSDRGIQDAA